LIDKRWDDILVAEHEMIERAMAVLKTELEKLTALEHDRATLHRALDFLLEFGDKIHNTKEEKFLFPLLIERGIPEGGPIHVMLLEHEAERQILGNLLENLANLEEMTSEAREDFSSKGTEYLMIRANHIWKENDILYMMGRRVLTDEDNMLLVNGFESINLESYGEKNTDNFLQMLTEMEGSRANRSRLIENLSYEQIDAIMEAMPLEVTFVDAKDTVQYFNRLDREKIFVRTRSVIGRKVEKCHPAESVDKVLEIVEGFRDGTLENADFWINFKGEKIMIRYFPVRDRDGKYLGVLETSQEIGSIQELKGEKRLLDPS